SVSRNSREVPVDWFVDLADPSAGKDLGRLDDRATAYLAAHDAMTEVVTTGNEAEAPAATVTDWHRGVDTPPEVAAPLELWHAPPGGGPTPVDRPRACQADARCAQPAPEACFPENGRSTRDAKKVCGSCPVKQQCLDSALANDERFGIWGGMSERERRRLRKKSS